MFQENTKQWWINEFNLILAGSNYEAIDNPNEKEDNVVIVSRGSKVPPHYIGVKPRKNGTFGLWTPKNCVDILPKNTVPSGGKPKGQKYYFDGLSDREFAFNVVRSFIGLPLVPVVVTSISDKIQTVIKKYKENFEYINKEERYKWEAAKCYSEHWDINTEDFTQMLIAAFKQSANLLTSGMYYAYKGLIDYSSVEPENMRSLFRVLYNEELPFSERYDLFRDGFSDFVEETKAKTGKTYNHYQDLHALSVYLFFQYPEKYFIYKSSMYTGMRDRIGFKEEKTNKSATISKFENHQRMCKLIVEEIHKDPELQEMSKSRLDISCFQDEAYHLLAMDIAYFGGVHMSDLSSNEPVYWPSLEEYNPGITSEQWLSFLQEDSKNYPSTLKMLKTMLDLGGEATCFKLAEVLGENAQSWSARGSAMGRRAKNKYQLPPCMDVDTERFFPVAFLGRKIEDLYSWKLRDELKEALENMDLTKVGSITDVELNTILYGPPGTGKTYHTVIYAVAIIENKKLAEVASENYDDVLARYNEYKKNGRIAFTTFHQSFGYEEFIEGIKPVVSDDEDGKGDIHYAVASGIFKEFCDKAVRHKNISQVSDYGLNESPNIWKVSLEGTGDNPTRTECLNNNHIRIGWDAYGKDITDETDFSVHGGKNPINAFINRMRIGDIVLSCYSASTIDAIGVITGDYEWHDEYHNYKRLRNVNWIVKNIDEDIMNYTDGTSMTLSSVYRLSNITLNDVLQIIEKYTVKEIIDTVSNENYVFIIDEINRGNISKIFGELITLIEPYKRIGANEEMTAILPYSAKQFGVPNNVYIIGTMNTADRSIATIDTALRRRFYFKEMLPEPIVLQGVYVEDVSIAEMLLKINKRISVLYDREHTIGHAYFMPLKANPTVETLARIFENNIIPLLQEYFYEDYEKIRLVLGDNNKPEDEQFIVAKSNDYIALFGNVDIGLDDGYSYEINKDAFKNIEAYRSI